MSVFCSCGKLATHRVRWDEWARVSVPIRTPKGSRCLDCARVEADEQTKQRQADFEHADSFWCSDATRYSFKTVTEIPVGWQRKVRQIVKRKSELINPRGHVEVYVRRNVLFIDVWEPKEGKPPTWEASKVLFSVRYLARVPLVFRPVDPDEPSPSPHTSREQHERFSATLPPVVTRPDGSA